MSRLTPEEEERIRRDLKLNSEIPKTGLRFYMFTATQVEWLIEEIEELRAKVVRLEQNVMVLDSVITRYDETLVGPLKKLKSFIGGL